jgi:hypothetical protein
MQPTAVTSAKRITAGLATAAIAASAFAAAPAHAAPTTSAVALNRMPILQLLHRDRTTVLEGQTAYKTISAKCLDTKPRCKASVRAIRGSAVANEDFTPVSKAKALKRGQIWRIQLAVATIDDDTCEFGESFNVQVRVSGTRPVSYPVLIEPSDCRVDGATGQKIPDTTPTTPPETPVTPPAQTTPPVVTPTPGPDDLTIKNDTFDYGTGTIATCETANKTGVKGQGCAWGHYIDGCTVKLTCPTSVRICSAKAESKILTENRIGHRVTLNSRMRVFSASMTEFWHRDVSCAQTDWCAAEDQVMVRGGETASVECNGVRQSGPEANRAKVICKLDLERTTS